MLGHSLLTESQLNTATALLQHWPCWSYFFQSWDQGHAQASESRPIQRWGAKGWLDPSLPSYQPPWRNRLARSAVNRKVGGSSPPGGARPFSFSIVSTDTQGT